MDIKIVLVLIGAIAGFLVGQANGIMERRSERKKALNRALCELLEIRHRFAGYLYMMRRFGTDLEIHYEVYDQIVSGLPEGLLWDKSISERYNDAVSVISMHAPLLAYSLRSKDIVGLFCGKSPICFGASRESHSVALKSMEVLERALIPVLDETIESISGLIGRTTKRQTVELLNKIKDVPEEVKNNTDQIIENLKSALVSAGNNSLQARLPDP